MKTLALIVGWFVLIVLGLLILAVLGMVILAFLCEVKDRIKAKMGHKSKEQSLENRK